MRRATIWPLLPVLTVSAALGAGIAHARQQAASPEGRAIGGRRVALIVGNDGYSQAPLVTARNDARAVAAALRALPEPFMVTLVENATQGQMASAIGAVAENLGPRDIAFFYFAGHGVQIDRENFLVPVDYNGRTAFETRLRTVPASSVASALSTAGVAVMVLDACRDNPFQGTRAFGSGLSAMEPRGMLIAYSAAAGQTVGDDAKAGTTLFARELVAALAEPGLTVSEIFQRVRTNVLAATGDRQWPAVYEDLAGEVVFRPGAASAAAADAETAAWQRAANTLEVKPLERFLALFPEGKYASAARVKMLAMRAMPPVARASERGAASTGSGGDLLARGNAADDRGAFTEAIALFRRAADQRHAGAMNNLGIMYARGRGVPEDDAEAVAWYRRAVEAGSADAMYNLGGMHDRGRGVPEDQAQALSCYRKAAAAGQADAMTTIGTMYANGRAVPKDEATAVSWYQKAAAAGNVTAMVNMAIMSESGRGIPKDDAQAASWYRKAADAGDAHAMGDVGWTYLEGVGVPQDDATGVSWFRKGADLGDVISMFNLGAVYEMGRGVQKDIEQAIGWYRKAAAAGYEKAKETLKRLGRS